MAMLDRYKKTGGFLQLLILIETSGKQKQEQFLNLIAQESPVWEEAIRQKSLTIDKILAWNPVYLGEVLTRIQPLTLATALNGFPKDKVETILGCIGISDRRKIQQVIDESKPTPAEVSTCIMKIIGETRGLVQSGILKMDKINPDMVIQDGIEEHLNSAAMQKSLQDSLSSMKPAAASDVPPEDGTELRFELKPAPAAGKPDPKHDSSREEVEFLKKKVNQVIAENGALKQEISALRGKLDQIKRIA